MSNMEIRNTSSNWVTLIFDRREIKSFHLFPLPETDYFNQWPMAFKETEEVEQESLPKES